MPSTGHGSCRIHRNPAYLARWFDLSQLRGALPTQATQTSPRQQACQTFHSLALFQPANNDSRYFPLKEAESGPAHPQFSSHLTAVRACSLFLPLLLHPLSLSSSFSSTSFSTLPRTTRTEHRARVLVSPRLLLSSHSQAISSSGSCFSHQFEVTLLGKSASWLILPAATRANSPRVYTRSRNRD